jgi:hypothetical protein
MTADIRNGRGHRAYRRKQQRLKREGRDCAWCGKPINYELPPTDAMSFTADHPEAVNRGGHLYQQDLAPMHRRCNAKKGDSAQPIIRPAE